MTNPVAGFRLTLDGKDISDRFRPRLISLTLSEKRGNESDQLDIVLDDSDGRLAIPKQGALLSLQLGWAAGTGVAVGLLDKGKFMVDEVEHSGSPDIITIRARAVDFTNAARVRNLKSWTGKTLGDVIGELAGKLGLTAKVAPALAGITIPVIEQGRMSDMALIRKLGKRHDAVATVKAGNLLFSPIGKGTTASGRPLPMTTIDRSAGDSHSFKRAARDDYSGVTAYWHDPDSAERTGETVGETDKPKHLKRTYGSKADATAAAGAENSRQKRAAATLSFALALGRPGIYPEQRTRVSGFKPEIDAITWLIVDVTHNLNDRGLTTSVNFEQAV